MHNYVKSKCIDTYTTKMKDQMKLVVLDSGQIIIMFLRYTFICFS